MQGTRFDALTRRAFGAAAGSLAASLLAIGAQHPAPAKKKKRCKKFDAGCVPGSKKRKCCPGLACQAAATGGARCCRKTGTPCGDVEECCAAGSCATVDDGSLQQFCCNFAGGPCARKRDCCTELVCSGGQCAQP